MVDENNSKNTGNSAQPREERLKAALKANLARRKVQSRVREQVSETKKSIPGASGQDKDT